MTAVVLPLHGTSMDTPHGISNVWFGTTRTMQGVPGTVSLDPALHARTIGAFTASRLREIRAKLQREALPLESVMGRFLRASLGATAVAAPTA